MQVKPESTGPSLAEIAEESVLLLGGTFVAGPMLPGFIFCFAGLIFLGVPGLLVLLIPVVMIGLLAAAAGLVILLAVLPVRAGGRAARGVRRAIAARRALER